MYRDGIRKIKADSGAFWGGGGLAAFPPLNRPVFV